MLREEPRRLGRVSPYPLKGDVNHADGRRRVGLASRHRA